jgi:hypothetical protein
MSGGAERRQDSRFGCWWGKPGRESRDSTPKYQFRAAAAMLSLRLRHYPVSRAGPRFHEIVFECTVPGSPGFPEPLRDRLNELFIAKRTPRVGTSPQRRGLFAVRAAQGLPPVQPIVAGPFHQPGPHRIPLHVLQGRPEATRPKGAGKVPVLPAVAASPVPRVAILRVPAVDPPRATQIKSRAIRDQRDEGA